MVELSVDVAEKIDFTGTTCGGGRHDYFFQPACSTMGFQLLHLTLASVPPSVQSYIRIRTNVNDYF